ncbi:FAD-dependent oxidoreductase [Glycomyces luteolus]|uniref:FAD-dependent oxidoreductase n=1 Tax=Glycomyces luteolus TaxID=2670330 RepID=A0A9X3P8Y6_9ACTN|nr:FAD-dependent oxidoreductase [Glycomyces luteolus]MDA1360993.1 FAD-dependent oxidoreductase [Glycomyces luteolus]
MRRIAIVGAGLAGFSAGQELRRLGFDGDLTVIGAEPHRPYRRPPLSKEHLLGESDLSLRGADELGAAWRLGRAATGLDLERRAVLVGEAAIGFDGLVIATGLRAKSLPEGTALPGVHFLRGLDDARGLRREIEARPRTVVVGGGFIGSETAATLRGLGLEVTLISGRPVLRSALGAEVGAIAEAMHREHGVEVRTGRMAGVSGTGRVERVHLQDGGTVTADLVVAALGAEPETEWLRGTGLGDGDGVMVGADGLVAPGIAAAGDVARWPHPLHSGRTLRIEHYANAAEQGAHAARALLGGIGPYTPLPNFWSHLYGRRLQAVGFTGADCESRLVAQEPGHRFMAEYRHRGRLVGVAAAGFARAMPEYRQRIAQALAPVAETAEGPPDTGVVSGGPTSQRADERAG